MPKGIKGFQKGHEINIGRKHSLETKKKISQNHVGTLGYKHSEETIEKMRLARIGEGNGNWKGGKVKNGDAYILIKKSGHPFAGKNNYVMEHRLIMEKHLGRYLKPEEVVHHVNGVPDDNRIENFMLFANDNRHKKYHKKLREREQNEK